MGGFAFFDSSMLFLVGVQQSVRTLWFGRFGFIWRFEEGFFNALFWPRLYLIFIIIWFLGSWTIFLPKYEDKHIIMVYPFGYGVRMLLWI